MACTFNLHFFRYQDNNAIQTELLFIMAADAPHPRVTVVGDDDQCIYAFRGAEPGNFERFKVRIRTT